MRKTIYVFSALAFMSCSNSGSFKVGDNIKTKEQTVGTVTESGFDEMISISNAKDGVAFGDMILEGRMFIVPENTTLNVEEIKVGRIKAQYGDKSLWFNSAHVE